MSLPSPPSDHLRLTTNFADPHSTAQTEYQTTYEPNPSFEADRSLLTNDIKPADLAKARLKDFDHRIHSLPAYAQMKRLRLFSRFLSACLNVFMFSAMVFTITIFISTRHTQVDGRGLWPANPETWPTYLLLSGAIVTLLVSISVLIFYCMRYEQAVRSWKVVMVMVGCEVLVWVIITTLYRVEKKRGDLWGWSCLQIARDLEHDLTGHKNANFHTLCKIQVSLLKGLADMTRANEETECKLDCELG